MRFKFLLTALLIALPGAQATPALAADEIADYCLIDMTNKQQCVSDYRGKWLIINFWATWCPPCIEEMPELQRFFEQNRQQAHLWGVTFEDSNRERIEAFVERLGISYPILGYGQDPLTGFGSVTVLPTTFIIDPQGLFFHRFEGPITARNLSDAIPSP